MRSAIAINSSVSSGNLNVVVTCMGGATSATVFTGSSAWRASVAGAALGIGTLEVPNCVPSSAPFVAPMTAAGAIVVQIDAHSRSDIDDKRCKWASGNRSWWLVITTRKSSHRIMIVALQAIFRKCPTKMTSCRCRVLPRLRSHCLGVLSPIDAKIVSPFRTWKATGPMAGNLTRPATSNPLQSYHWPPARQSPPWSFS